jgi:Ni,Fe-hydrogenase III component G
MTPEETLTLATELAEFGGWVEETSRPEPNRLDFRLKSASELVPMVAGLRVKRLGFLSAITGLDPGPETGQLEILYHFCAGAAVITLRVRVPREGGAVPSLGQIIPSAEAYERELSEMFGVTVTGAHTPDHLYLPDDWPAGVYPLRKDHQPEAVLQSVNGREAT